MFSVFTHEYFMKQALLEAQKAFEADEVPIGAVVVCENQIIARSHNWTEHLKDITAHAEILAITAASKFLSSKYLNQCQMYVTVEPCVMCAGALFWSQLEMLVYGAGDNKKGFHTQGHSILHPKTKLISGIMEKECADLMKLFFQKKRN